MKQAQRTRVAGFSMIELVLVLSLLPIVIGVYMHSLDPGSASLDRAVRKVEADLRYAQQLSMNEEIGYGLSTQGADAYWIYRGNPGTVATDPQTRGELRVNFATNYRGVTFGNAYQIQFDLTGRPNGGTTTLRLQQGNRARTITINGTTGLMQVQ